jgi:ArsR family transcriptional regulator
MITVMNLWKALGDETRLRILKLLEEGELCVYHLMRVLNMGQSRISRHMGILKQAGLVEDRRMRKWILYRLAAKGPTPESQTILQHLPTWLNDQPLIQQDKKRLWQMEIEEEIKAIVAGQC